MLLTLRMGNVDPPNTTIVNKTMINVDVIKTCRLSCSKFKFIDKANAMAPRKPEIKNRKKIEHRKRSIL